MRTHSENDFLFPEPPQIEHTEGGIDYQFTIIPKKINERCSKQKSCKNTVLIKIGNKSVKCQQLECELKLNLTIDDQTDQQQFESSKGMVKIYDLKEDGSEVINCVGAFDVQQIIQSKGKIVEIVKNIGHIVFFMEAKVEIIHKETSAGSRFSEESLQFGDQYPAYSPDNIGKNPILDLKSAINLGKRPESSLLRSNMKHTTLYVANDDEMVEYSDMSSIQSLKKIQNINFIQDQVKEQLKDSNKRISLDQCVLKENQSGLNIIKSPKGIKKEDFILTFDDLKRSLKDSINNNMSVDFSCPEMSEEYQKMELEILGQQLISERRKTKQYEEKMQKQLNKIVALRNKNKNWGKKWQQITSIFKHFFQFMKKDEKGQCIFQINEKKQKISMKYKINDESEHAFKDILDLIVSVIDGNQQKTMIPVLNSKPSGCDTQQYSSKLVQENKNLKAQIEKLKHENKMREFSIKNYQQNQHIIERLKTELEKQSKQFEVLLNKIQTIKGVNMYLKEKDAQMEQMISAKEATIEHLRKNLTNNNNQLDEMDEEIAHHKKVLKNMELVIEELKEELETKEDQIEEYEKKYGKFKNSRSKDLQNHIKDCLIWLNQEQGAGDSLLENTVNEENSPRKPHRNLLNFIKNEEYLYGLAQSDILKIQEEINILAVRVNEFMGETYSHQLIQPSFTK